MFGYSTQQEADSDWNIVNVDADTVIVLSYSMQKGTEINVVDPYLRFDYVQNNITFSGADHGTYDYYAQTATFNLTTDRIFKPVVFWTVFYELAGIKFMT